MTADADLALAINVIRGLAMDAPQAADSGHPGTAMALAPLAHVLWTRVLRYDAEAPHWPDRDRFVLSAGHASILLYSMLHLTGYGLTRDDLRAFRQWGSQTPGHPEVHHTAGVEVTTGPLGQGFANAVGMGIAERWLRARFGPELCDHRTYVICSDGDLMEGVSHEAASLAGHLGLGRLIYVYDDNHITIDGPTELAYSDDVAGRFPRLRLARRRAGRGRQRHGALEAALRRAAADEEAPSLLILRSHIGWPSPRFTDTRHGARQPAGRRRGRRDQGDPGPPAGRDLLGPRRRAGAVPGGGAPGPRPARPGRSGWRGNASDREAYEACIGRRGLPRAGRRRSPPGSPVSRWPPARPAGP